MADSKNSNDEYMDFRRKFMGLSEIVRERFADRCNCTIDDVWTVYRHPHVWQGYSPLDD